MARWAKLKGSHSLVFVRRLFAEHEGDLIALRLSERGIQCWIDREQGLAGLPGNIGWVGDTYAIYVRPTDAGKAFQALGSQETAP